MRAPAVYTLYAYKFFYQGSYKKYFITSLVFLLYLRMSVLHTGERVKELLKHIDYKSGLMI